MADALIGLIGQAYFDAYASIVATPSAPEAETLEDDAKEIVIGPTFREQVIRARRGQGVFRSNVLLREGYCRVTKVHGRKHLKASHIKPWRDGTDAERLDGANGLLLSPHIDHLFDQGYITFSPGQRLLIVPEIRDSLLDAWGIDGSVGVGEFTPEQSAYLDYHRSNVSKG
jgi:putative restriction endonuclease